MFLSILSNRLLKNLLISVHSAFLYLFQQVNDFIFLKDIDLIIIIHHDSEANIFFFQ